MTILHILEDYSLKSGGLRTVVKDLNQRLINNGIKSHIISSDKEDGDNIYIVESKKTPWRYSKKWKTTIHKICTERKVDIIHIHGVWMYPQYIAAKFAIKNNIPFLITTHGMYEPWLWEKGKLKKKLYFNLISKPVFSQARKIHAITKDEKIELQKLFPKNTIVEIPNLIDHNVFKTEKTNQHTEKYILYLGRLDNKKGIDILIKAFANISDNSPYKLKIAGGFNTYKKELEELTQKLNIADKVAFLGLVKGDKKETLYTNASLFVAPSHSEVVGMVNLEAAMCKTPVITTYQTGLMKEWSNNGGRLINPNVTELTTALKEYISLSSEKRLLKGQKLYNFVIQNYSWEKRFIDWKELYINLAK